MLTLNCFILFTPFYTFYTFLHFLHISLSLIPYPLSPNTYPLSPLSILQLSFDFATMNRMKRFLLILLFCFLINLSHFVYAADSTGDVPVGYTLGCMSATYCAANLPKDASANADTAAQINRSEVKCPAGDFGGHSAYLKLTDSTKNGTNFQANTKTYIIECFAQQDADSLAQSGEVVTAGTICTTGNPNTDIQAKLYQNLEVANNQVMSNYDIIREKFHDYEFAGMYDSISGNTSSNPLLTDAQKGITPQQWVSKTSGMKTKEFKVLQFISAKPTIIPTTVTEPTTDPGNQASDKIASLDFYELGAGQSIGTINDAKSCVKIAWDPYGRVFDALTLEPVENAYVLLTKQRADGSFTKVDPFNTQDVPLSILLNPYTTKKDGFFSFIVPDSTYRLSLPPEYNTGVTIVTDINQVNASYKQIYSDLYPILSGEDIVQKGVIQHRDIPVLLSNKKTDYEIRVSEYFYELNKNSGYIELVGRTNLPFTTIRAYTLKHNVIDSSKIERMNRVVSLKTDDRGQFQIYINPNKFAINEYFGEIELEKGEIYKDLPYPVRTIKFSPIFNQLAGRAVTSDNQVIANAKVSVLIGNNTTPFNTTIADGKGIFSFPSNTLPNVPYSIRYTDKAGKTYATSLPNFIRDNSAFLKKAQLNLSGKKEASVKNVNFKDNAKVLDTTKPNDDTAPPTNPTLYLILITIAILVTMIIMATLFYLKNRK